MEWSNEAIMEFLDLYEGEPCIWNPQNADHKDRNKIHDAWKRIEGSISIEFSLNELKKKKENLMATYRKLALKVKNRKRTGATNKAYKPEWFAYEKMASFLNSIYTPRKTKTSDEGPENEQADPSTNKHPIPDPVESSDINTSCYNEKRNDTKAMKAAVIDQVGPPTSKRRKAEQTANVEKHMDETFTFIEQVAKKSNAAKDETSLFCELLCLKLKALDDGTREIAMHEINILMFNLKKPRQPYLPYNHSYQPGYFVNTDPHDLVVNPVESSLDGSEHSFSSRASSGYNPPATTLSQYGSNDKNN